MSYVVDVGYALDLSQISTAISKFKELQTEVGKADKSLNTLSKKAPKAGMGKAASAEVRAVGEAADQAGNKFDKLIEKNNLVRQYMVDGFTKGEASILATAKQAGILETQFGDLQKSLIQVAKLSTNPFDNSRGSVRALQKELTDLQDRIELNAKGVFASSKQLKHYSRAAEEVKGKVEQMGLSLTNPKGQEMYNKLLAKRRQEIEELIKSTNKLVDVEKTSQRLAKDNQRTLEKIASVERRMNVRQTSQQFGVNLQDASFLIDAKATGNMQLYNRALESTRKTMIQTIPVATTLRALFPAIGAIGVAAGLAAGTRQLLQMADAMRLVEARIRLVSSAGTDSAQVMTQLVEISKENRVNLDTTSRLYTRLVPALESFNVRMDGVTNATEGALRVTKAFGAALLISGANTQEAIAATTQFTQAMASGRLAGDEFRSVSEAAPAFLKAIADGSGYARSELKALSQEGLLSTELISKALIKMEDSLSSRAKSIPVTMGQAFEQVKTDVMVFSRELNESTGAVDAVVSAIRNLGVAVQGIGDALRFVKDKVIAPLNSVLNEMDTSVGQVALGLLTMRQLSISLAAVMGTTGAVSLGGAVAATAGTMTNLVKGIRSYTAAVVMSTALTGGFTTAMVVARGAVTALSGALLANPFTAVLAGLSVVAGAVWFNSQQAAASMRELEESFEASKKNTDILTEANGKMSKSWENLKRQAPEVANAIDRAFSIDGVKLLSDDQQRELDNLIKKMEELKKANQGDISGKQRVLNNEWIISLRKEHAALQDNYTLNQKIDTLNGQMEGKATDMIAKLKSEIREREIVNKLLKEGVGLKQAELLADLQSSLNDQFKIPEWNWAGGESWEAHLARSKSLTDQRNKALAEGKSLIEESLRLEEEISSTLGDRKNDDKKNPYVEEIKTLQQMIPLTKQLGDAEKARIVASGLSVATAQQLLNLRREMAVLENAPTRAEESALVQRELDLLMQGLSVKEATAILEREALSRAMTLAGYTASEITARQELLNLSNALKDADQERQKALEALKETYDEFLKPEKLEIGDIFGDAAQGAGALLNAMYDIAEQQEEIAKWQETVNKSGLKGAAREAELAKLKKKEGQLDLANMRAIAGASKQFFDEKSKGYKVLQRLEQAMFAMQLYNQARELTGFLTGIGQKIAAASTEAAAFISLEAAKATAAGTTAVAAQGQIPIVGFALAAAMAALLIGMGVGIKGGGGSGKAPVYNEGKGTVLGDSDAQSESIKNSIEALEEYARIELPITSAMLKSLRNIESNIRGLATLLIRQIPGSELIANVQQGTTQNLSVENLQATLFSKIDPILGGFVGGIADKIHGFATNIVGKLTGGLNSIGGDIVNSVLGGIFGKVSTSISASGLTAPMQTMTQILEDGFNLLEFVTVKIKKKSWFSSKTSYKTQTAQADEELSRQFSLIFENFYDSILLAADPLGANLDVVAEQLGNFVVDIGKINLKGKSGAEIQETLEAVFGQQADLMAKAALSGFEEFQKVGEGYFETVMRLASSLERAKFAAETFNVELIALEDVLNKQGDVAMELFRQSLIAAEEATYGFVTGVAEIVQIFNGSIDDLEELWVTITDVRQNLRAAGKAFEDLSTSMILGARGFENLQRGLEVYFDEYLTDQERHAELLRQMTQEFGMLGLAVPATRQEFIGLVNSIDTTTEAGQTLFGAIMALVPAFKELEDAVAASMDAIKVAYEELFAALDEVIAGREKARQAVLSAYNEEVKALDAIIKKRDDAKTALEAAYKRESSAIEATITKIDALRDSLLSFVDSINDRILDISNTDAAVEYNRYKQLVDRAKISGSEEDVQAAINAGQSFSQGAADSYSSRADSIIALARVREDSKGILDVLDAQKTDAERQLEALKASVRHLIDIDGGVISVQEAINNLLFANAEAYRAEQRKDYLHRQLVALGVIDASVLTVEQAIRQLRTADQAAREAEAQKEILSLQLEAMGILNRSVLLIPEAILSLQSILSGMTRDRANPNVRDDVDRAFENPDFNTGRYLMTNTDVSAHWNTLDQATKDQFGGLDVFAAWHYTNHGIDEGRHFANGGAFTNGVVSSPTKFNMGLMGEAGPEAIMPLAQASNGALGVRAMVDGKVAEGLSQIANKLDTIIVENRAQQGAIATNTNKMAKVIERADNGDSINVAIVVD